MEENSEKKCFDPDHEPPRHLKLQPGQKVRHTCPGCGKSTILESVTIV